MNKLYIAAFIQANHIFSHKKLTQTAKFQENLYICIQQAFCNIPVGIVMIVMVS